MVALPWSLVAAACGGDTIVNQIVEAPDAGASDDDAGTPSPSSVVRRACEEDSDCDNGLVCDGAEACEDGFCQLGEPEDCDDDIECTLDRCSDTLGRCVHLAPDRDGDGHADAKCEDADGEPLGDDCDDTDGDRFPGNVERCDDNHDEDCDLDTVGLRDQDRDGFTDASCCNGDNCGEDCDDRSRGVNPNVPEVCDDFDNDCDGTLDEGLLVEAYPDSDGDGFGDDGSADGGMPMPVMLCDRDAPARDANDCNDSDPTINRQQVEFCDGEDNDCDGKVDEAKQDIVWYLDRDGDGFGGPNSGTVVSCTPVPGASVLATDCDDNDPATNPLAEEICDGKDNDCDGVADFLVGPGNFEDDDGDGAPDPGCNVFPEDCDDNDDTVYPGAPELCDGRDNDCNGIADGNTVLATWFLDDDRDGFGDNSDPGMVSCEVLPGRVRMLGDCDDSDPGVNPAAGDDCGGTSDIDDDCDSNIDEGEQARSFYPDLDDDGFGNSLAAPFSACAAPSGYAQTPGDCDDSTDTIAPGASENCAMRDGIDNDCDGDIDCLDTDCQGEPSCSALYMLQPPTSIPSVATADKTAPLTFTLLDPNGQPVQGQDVTFTASEGAAALPSTATTDANGQVQIALRAGRQVGTYRFTGTNLDSRPTTVELSAVPPPPGHIYTFANVDFAVQSGSRLSNFTQGPATENGLYTPYGMVRASDGSLYVASYNNCMVFRITPRGDQRLVAGGGGCGSGDANGDLTPAVGAAVYLPYGLALDEARNRLYISQSSSGPSGRVRVVDLTTGIINTFAGSGSDSNSIGDGASANAAYLNAPRGMLVGADGSLYISEVNGQRIRKVDTFGIITTYIEASSCVAGDPVQLQSCDSYCQLLADGQGGAYLNGIFCGGGLPTNLRGIAHIGDIDDPRGTMRFIAGAQNGNSAGYARGVSFTQIGGMAADSAGNLFVTERSNHRVRRIDFHTSAVTTIAGTGSNNTLSAPYGDYGSATAAEFSNPANLLMTPPGDLYVSDGSRHALRAVHRAGTGSPTSVQLATTAGDGQALFVGERLGTPFSVEVTGAGSAKLIDVPVYFSVDRSAFELGASSGVTDVAGQVAVNGRAGILPGAYNLTAELRNLRGETIDSQTVRVSATEPTAGLISAIVNRDRITSPAAPTGPAISSRIRWPTSMVSASDGSFYIGLYDYYVARVKPDGTIETVAGNGTSGQGGDGDLATNAQLGIVWDLALDETNGLLYILSGNTIRYVDLQTGIIEYLAGAGSQTSAPYGDGGSANDAVFANPSGLALSPDGDLYVADDGHNAIRRIDLSTGIIDTPTGLSRTTSCNGTGTLFYDCFGRCAVDFTSGGDMLVYSRACGSDVNSTRYVVSRYATGTGILTPIAGQNATTTADSMVLAANATLGQPGDLVVGPGDVVYIAEQSTHRVRAIDALDGTARINLVAGTGMSGSSDSPDLGEFGPATAKNLYQPTALAFDDKGRLLIALYYHHQISRVW